MPSDHRQHSDGNDVSQKDPESSPDFGTHPLAEQLVEWFIQNGGWISPDVQIVYSESRGFHMRAVRALSASVVASSPLTLTLSSLNLDPSEKEVLHVENSLLQCRGKIPDHILTYLLLIEQRNKGKNSPWHAYIACLPRPESMTTPLWFDERDLAFLAGTSLAPAARERKEDMHRQWELAISVLRELGIALADEIDFKSLLWAATIFTSRAFISTHILPNRETIPLLFPVVDILNHSVSAKVEWDFQPHRSFSLKCLEGDTFEAGHELFNNYAPKQNDELLLGYGFCLENNPIEQFALKLAFPPVLREYAEETGLLEPEKVPFGMSPAFLATDPDREQHFLRAKGHPFGRYDCHVPFFRGVPPYIVHLFFVQTVLALDLDVTEINVERPGVLITLHVLLLLHRAIEQRCHSLPVHIQLEPSNEKQKYARIYRDGQAKIIHSIRRELKAVIDSLRAPSHHPFPLAPMLLSPTEALTTFTIEFPTEAETFQKGLELHDLLGPDNEAMTWALLLTAFAALILSTPTKDNSLISAWLRDLFARHPLPALEDGIQDAETYTFIDDHLSDFVKLPSSDPDATPADVLDDLGLTFVDRSPDDATPVFIHGRTLNLDVRIVMWAMKVVEQEALPVFEDGVVKKCLYVRPWKGGEEGSGEEWMYEDVEGPDV